MTAEQFSSVTSVTAEDSGSDKLTIKSGDASDEIDLSVVETTSENVVFTGAGDDTVTASGGVDKIVLESVFDGADTVNDFKKAGADLLYIDFAEDDIDAKYLTGAGGKINFFSAKSTASVVSKGTKIAETTIQKQKMMLFYSQVLNIL